MRFIMRRVLRFTTVACAMAFFIWCNINRVIVYGETVGLMPVDLIQPEDRLKIELSNHVSRANNHLLNEARKAEKLALREQIAEEIALGEMEMMAQLIQAEAGNQDFKGKCLVADVVLNRIDAGWGETVEDIIFSDNQFSVIFDGAYDAAAWNISEECFKAAEQEYLAKRRVDGNILYFTAGRYGEYGTPAYRHGNHYFSY